MENSKTTTTSLSERRSSHPPRVHAAHRTAHGRCTLALVSGALVFAYAAVGWGATEATRSSVVLWSGDDQWVRLEPQDDPAAAPNDHPAQVGVTALTTALGALRVHLVDPDTGTESHRPVFTPDELGNLTSHVASGLAKAGPRQDVTFSTVDGRPLAAGGLIRKPGVNAGRVFYSDGRLNVIFGELQSSYRKKNVYGQRSEDFTPRRQGSRSQATEQKWALADGPGLQFHSTNDGAVRNDWVVIDPAVARAEIPPAPTPVAAAAAPVAAAAPPAPPAPVATTPLPKASTAPVVATPEPAARSAMPDPDVEQRLQKLKELKDKGLITDEAYRAKMQEILSEL